MRSKGLLIAIGVNAEGQREVLGFQAGDGESHATWTAFFRQFKSRGLQAVDLVVSDNHGGLVKAIGEQFQGAMWQRCHMAPFSRNLLETVSPKQRATVHGRLKDLYNSPDLEEACRRRDAMDDYWLERDQARRRADQIRQQLSKIA